MKTAVRDLMTGVVAISGIVVFAILLMRFGELSNVGTNYAHIRLAVPSAKGLSQIAPVSLNGVKIGDVTSIDIDPQRDGLAIISLRYDKDVRIPTDFLVAMDSALIGQSGLDITIPVGRDSTDVSYVEGEDEVYERTIAALTDQLAEPISRVQAASDAFVELAETYTELGESLNSLTTDAKASLAEFDETNRSLRTEMARLGDATERTSEELAGTLRTLDSTLGETQTMMATINAGEGSVGLLLNDPEFYHSLTTSAERLERAMFEVELLIQKIRDEGLGVGF